MVRLRGRYLSCFYCGKRSTLKYDGQIRDFLCTNCDATNYLDENGEITDPPVAESSSSAKQYVVPQSASASFSSSPTDSIFCETCLKNQRLFTASLAQYLPDDPSHPDYAELERKYYRFRKDLEKRYPQVCAECAKKVEGRIRQAGYTAKTDHLRRMMERSRGSRRVHKKTTPLDLANAAGRWLWWGGLVMQMLWHLVNIARALELRENGMYDPDDRSTITMMITWLNRLPAFMPDAETLIRWSITAGFLSAWWNPHFVQVNRGFTRHLLGFTQWYSFQGLIIFFRYLFRSVLDMQGGKAQSKSAQLSAHVTMAGIMGLVYFIARRSIRVDTTPLFGPSERTVSALTSQVSSPAQERKTEEPKTLAEALTDALESANTTPHKMPSTWQDQNPLPPLRVPNNPFQPSREGSPLSFGGLGLSDRVPPPQVPPPQRVQQVQDPDEMDWSPIPNQTSTHRAFQQTPTSKVGNRPFGQSPTQPNGNPFWYKVPPPPVNPAHRLRNPPNAPFLRQKPAAEAVESKQLHFKSAKGGADRDNGREGVTKAGRIDFKNPSFFAPEKMDDADALADVFSQSFSVSQEEEDDECVDEPSSGAVNSGVSGGKTWRACELGVVAALLPSWLLLSFTTTVPYCKEFQLASLLVAGIVAIHGIGNVSQQWISGNQAPRSGPASYIMAAAGVMELSAVCWAAWQVWTGAKDVSLYGSGILALMLGHQAWSYVA